MIPFPDKKYQIIYADPQWNGLGWNNGSGLKCPANHYEVQDIDWIKSLPVKNIASKNCALFLWVTFPNLKAGFDVISRWGFEYSTCAFNWVKKNIKKDTFLWVAETIQELILNCAYWVREEVCKKQ